MTIPASQIVQITPNVLNAGGAGLVLNGLMLDNTTRVPVGTVAEFATAAAVADYFGPASIQADKADVYFNGFNNSNLKPGSFLVAQFVQDAVAGYLRGGDISAVPLATIKAVTGTLAIVVEGYNYPVASVDLSAATSQSNAASILETALNASKPTQASVTGAIAGTTLTVTAVASGTLAVGQLIAGSGVTAGTYITALGTGEGGTGTYTVSPTQTASSTSLTATGRDLAVTYDSVSGAFVITDANAGDLSTIAFATGTAAAPLYLTSATGAVLSQGSDAQTPEEAMDAIVAVNQNWVSFFNVENPDDADEFTVRLAFAEWTNDQNNRFAYICADTDASPTVSNDAAASLGAAIADADYSGTALIWEPSDLNQDAFISGAAASIDTTETNGRITFNGKGQTGITPGVTDVTTATNLEANGYNYYGAWATAAENFQGLAKGVVSGPFQWLDSYINQIWLNNSLQLALMNLLFNTKSIPYNQAGYTLIRQACMDPINAALNFGAIRAGVTLSAQQAASVNNAAGAQVSDILSTRGWYLQILDAAAQTRQARQSPPMKLWYMDGQSVQQINLASILVQ